MLFRHKWTLASDAQKSGWFILVQCAFITFRALVTLTNMIKFMVLGFRFNWWRLWLFTAILLLGFLGFRRFALA
jgi:hypothetical protein